MEKKEDKKIREILRSFAKAIATGMTYGDVDLLAEEDGAVEAIQNILKAHDKKWYEILNEVATEVGLNEGDIYTLSTRCEVVYTASKLAPPRLVL